MLQQGFHPDSADYDNRTALMLASVKVPNRDLGCVIMPKSCNDVLVSLIIIYKEGHLSGQHAG